MALCESGKGFRGGFLAKFEADREASKVVFEETEETLEKIDGASEVIILSSDDDERALYGVAEISLGRRGGNGGASSLSAAGT